MTCRTSISYLTVDSYLTSVSGRSHIILVWSADNFSPNLDKDQNVGPDLNPSCLTQMVFLKEFFRIIDFEKNRQTTKKNPCKFPRRQRDKGRFDTKKK